MLGVSMTMKSVVVPATEAARPFVIVAKTSHHELLVHPAKSRLVQFGNHTEQHLVREDA